MLSPSPVPTSAPTPAATERSPGHHPQAAASQNLAKLCEECGKRFRRTEHLVRHQRTHSRETPFRCPNCNRGFQRSDVRNRHVATTCLSKSSNVVSQIGYRGPTVPARARIACEACRFQKLKCTGRQPCPRCVRLGRECSFAGTAKSSSESLTNNEDIDMGLGQVQDAAQEQETYSQQEQGEQDSNEASSLSTTICANNEAPLTPMDLSGVSSASFSLSNTDSRSHDLGSGPNDRMLSTVQPEISLRSTEPNGESSSRDTTAQEISPGVGTERAQCDLVQFPASPSTSLSLDMARDLDSWLGFVPFEESIFNFFPLSDNYFDGSGLNVHAAAESQQLNGSLLSAQFDLQQLGDVFTQQHQLPAMARNLFPRLDHDASRWLTTKPSVSNFDRTIVNRFLNLFFAHVPSTFTSFESFSISGSTNEEEVLAAASFGGLYCTTRGSLVIARALCSDARRLFLTRIRTNFPLDIAEKIRLLRPMLLLELFGICSGDKRLCELTEAFHVQFLQILSESASTIGHNNLVLQRILQDFQLLECYRTTLLQMLPYLYPGMSIFSLVVESSGPKELKMIDIVNKLLSPTEPRLDLSDAQTSTTALASLLVLSYHASPSRSVTSSQSEGLCLWDKRFFESGLDAWLRSHTSSPDVSILLLFHIGMTSLNANMAMLQVLVRNACLRHDSHPAMMVAASQWCESHEAEIATMHADQVLELSANFYGNVRGPYRSVDPARSRLRKSSKARIEPPHVAICVYLAAITLWAACRANKSSSSATIRAVLDRGVRILDQLSLSAAINFTRILRYLQEA